MKTQNILIVSGYSGSGKTYLLKFLETIGYNCIDNIPFPVVKDLIELYNNKIENIDKLAISVDTRGGLDFSYIDGLLSFFKENKIQYKILFLVTQDETLIARFQQTRMSHPLSFKKGYKKLGLENLIKEEKKMLSDMRDNADLIIDTTRTTVHDLKQKVVNILNESKTDFWIRSVSFGFSKGIPQDVDFVFDLRFLPNPYFVDSLRELSGKNKEVRDYVMSDTTAKKYLENIKNLLDPIIPKYKLMKNYISLAFGCTGGRHRSVTFAVLMNKYFEEKGYNTVLEHRDLEDAI